MDVRVTKRLKDGKSQEITISSLYDGLHFGDVSHADHKRKIAFDSALGYVKNLKQIREELSIYDAKIAEEEDQSPAAQLKRKEKELAMSSSARQGDSKAASIEIIEEEIDDAPENYRKIASIVAIEDTEFLEINREKFNEILVSVLQQDISEKVLVLQLMDFFKVINDQ